MIYLLFAISALLLVSGVMWIRHQGQTIAHLRKLLSEKTSTPSAQIPSSPEFAGIRHNKGRVFAQTMAFILSGQYPAQALLNSNAQNLTEEEIDWVVESLLHHKFPHPLAYFIGEHGTDGALVEKAEFKEFLQFCADLKADMNDPQWRGSVALFWADKKHPERPSLTLGTGKFPK